MTQNNLLFDMYQNVFKIYLAYHKNSFMINDPKRNSTTKLKLKLTCIIVCGITGTSFVLQLHCWFFDIICFGTSSIRFVISFFFSSSFLLFIWNILAAFIFHVIQLWVYESKCTKHVTRIKRIGQLTYLISFYQNKFFEVILHINGVESEICCKNNFSICFSSFSDVHLAYVVFQHFWRVGFMFKKYAYLSIIAKEDVFTQWT